MKHATPAIIRREHCVLSAMLRCIAMLLAEHRRRNSLPDFKMLRAMLFYVDEFPEKLHHTKESQLLFPLLRGHSHEADSLLDRLDKDHVRSEQAIHQLEHDLLGFEMMGEPRRKPFELSMTCYVSEYLTHMRLEESAILPMAESVLTVDEWQGLDGAFLANHDPLLDYPADEGYSSLFQKILKELPSPLGLGSMLSALSGRSVPTTPQIDLR
jgi:hemerythrin-like domain-containing protein